jgi:hypothetical protein
LRMMVGSMYRPLACGLPPKMISPALLLASRYPTTQ